MKIYSKTVSSEKITREIELKEIPGEKVICPSDKIYLRANCINLKKIESFINVWRTERLRRRLNRTKRCEDIYFFQECNVYQFGKLLVTILYLRMSKCYQIQINPSKCSNPFLEFTLIFITNDENLSLMKIHLNVDLVCNTKTFIQHVRFLRKHFVRKFKNSLYGGKDYSIAIYDCNKKDKKRMKGTTRVELRFNSFKKSPIATFSKFKCLGMDHKLFNNILMPKSYKQTTLSKLEYEAMTLYLKEALESKCCRSETIENVFFKKSKELKDAFDRYMKRRTNEYVDLNSMFRRNFQIYLETKMSKAEETFCALVTTGEIGST